MHRSHERSNHSIHRDYEATNTYKDGFALLTIIEGISMGIEGRYNTAVLAINAVDQHIKMRQGSMTLMKYFDRVKSKLVAMERAGESLAETSIATEITVDNGHNAPTDANRRDAYDYVVAVRFVMQSNYPKYIAKTRTPGVLQLHMRSCISGVHNPLALIITLAWHLPTLECSRCLDSTVMCIPRWSASVVIIMVIVSFSALVQYPKLNLLERCSEYLGM